MEKTFDFIKELFSRDLSTSPLETAIFLFVIFGFFGLLIIANIMRRRKEKKRLSRLHLEKWNQLCEKYNLTEQEIALLEKAAQFLNSPEKKYLLLSDYQVFKNAMHEYAEKGVLDTTLIDSILKKTNMKAPVQKVPSFEVQRRKSKRRKVNITAKIAPIEHTTAHIDVKMFNLSSGGCKVENPDQRFTVGDDLKVSFRLNEKEYKDIPAEVVRTGPGSKTLNVSFGHVKKRAPSQ